MIDFISLAASYTKKWQQNTVVQVACKLFTVDVVTY